MRVSKTVKQGQSFPDGCHGVPCPQHRPDTVWQDMDMLLVEGTCTLVGRACVAWAGGFVASVLVAAKGKEIA